MDLELILENIRLGHIEKLLQETTDRDELQRGINLINESMHVLAEMLEADGWFNHSGSTWADETKPVEKTASVQTKVTSPEPVDFHHIPGELSGATPVVKPRVLNANRSSFTGSGSVAPRTPRTFG